MLPFGTGTTIDVAHMERYDYERVHKVGGGRRSRACSECKVNHSK
jgi:hypothetical protein